MDHTPLLNALPFGLCSSDANPEDRHDDGGVRHADARSLHPRHSHALDTRREDRHRGRPAGAGLRLQAAVQLAERD